MKPKHRKVPIISVIYNNEYEFNAILQDEKFVNFIYIQAWEAISEGIKNNSQTIYLCELGGTDQYVAIQRKNWSSIINDIKKRYEKQEDYEKCNECITLLAKI